MRALEIANWLVDYRAKDSGAPIDAMSLEKHLFYAQCFSLALHNDEIFSEDFEAWTYGPVVREVYARYANGNPIAEPVEAPPELASDLSAFLVDVVAFLSSWNAIQLSIATHEERPWKDARGDLDRKAHSNAKISKVAMRDFCRHLINDGEEYLSSGARLDAVPEPRWGYLYVAGVCARRLVRHPFYVTGTSLWGGVVRPEAIEYPDDVYAPPRGREIVSLEIKRGSTVKQIRASFEASLS